VTVQPADDLSLDTRMGWPPGLRTFLDRYPREVWSGHRNLGQTARFWLQRHDMFRDLGGALQAGTGEFREGRIQAPAFRGWFVPRLQFFLSELHGHHQIEDSAYFPLFQAAEPRLLRGFEVLEGDHELIHGRIERTIEAANAFLASEAGDPSRFAADAYAAAADTLLAGLLRHLLDEEDLIVPLILERGEGALGL
jgi:hypothetical protein